MLHDSFPRPNELITRVGFSAAPRFVYISRCHAIMCKDRTVFQPLCSDAVVARSSDLAELMVDSSEVCVKERGLIKGQETHVCQSYCSNHSNSVLSMKTTTELL